MSVGAENLFVVEGDLLDAKEVYLVHQCNCITVKGAHLSADVFERFPFANIYIDRLKSGKRDTPGSIIVRGNGATERYVINALAQYYPGKSRFATDTHALRKQWFQLCLDEIAKIPNLQSLAFPHNIGCGAAGGDWYTYYQMIVKFAKSLPRVHISLYKLPEPATPMKQTTLQAFIKK